MATGSLKRPSGHWRSLALEAIQTALPPTSFMISRIRFAPALEQGIRIASQRVALMHERRERVGLRPGVRGSRRHVRTPQLHWLHVTPKVELHGPDSFSTTSTARHALNEMD
jgi:hypothetical protein